MKVFIAMILLVGVHALNGQSQCLNAVPQGSRLCYDIQETGLELAENIERIDNLVQDTIYQSIVEGSKILAAGMAYLKNLISSLKISSVGTAPIEQSTINALKLAAESMAISSIATANREIHAVLIQAVKQLIGDDAFVNRAVGMLAFSSSIGRKRRTLEVSDPTDLGNSVDGIVAKLLPAVNQTLRQADLKMIGSFKGIFNAFTQSIKQLIGSNAPVNFDVAERNLEGLVTKAGKILIDAKVEFARVLFTNAVRNLNKILALVSTYKTDNIKLGWLLKPAAVPVSAANNRALSPTNDTGVTMRIAAAVANLQKYYEELKKIVST